MGIFADPLISGTVANFTMLFYNGILGLSGSLVGWIIFLPRIWDAITDPLIGKLSDNCRSPMGRRRPYFFFGGLVMVVAYILLWAPPALMESHNALAIYLLVVSTVFYTGYTAFTIPYSAMAIEMTPDYKERTSLMAFRKIFHGCGDMLVLSMPFLATTWLPRHITDLSDRSGFGIVGLCMGIVCAVAVTTAFLGTRERSATELAGKMSLQQSMIMTLKNRVFLRLTMAVFALVLSIFTIATYSVYLFQFYLQRTDLMAILGLWGGFVGIVSALPWGIYANRFGKPAALFSAQALILTASLLTFVCINKAHPNLTFVYFTIYSCGWSGVLILLSSLLADIVDMDELESGERREGSYGGVFGFLFKLGIAGSAPVMGMGLDLVGFSAELGAAQSDVTFLNLRLLTCFGGAFFAGIGLLLLWRFPLTPEQVLAIREQLEERRGRRTAIIE
jgi:GPH family glycoside/pentoside/hexuronide:cation symporter